MTTKGVTSEAPLSPDSLTSVSRGQKWFSSSSPSLHTTCSQEVVQSPSPASSSSSSASLNAPSSVTAVTRSWSDMNHWKLMMTFAAGSFFYSAAGQPFFLAIARQQHSSSKLSARQVFREAVFRDGWRSLFRGTGIAVSGTVSSELLYYLVLEYGKEKLPFQHRESRSFLAGLMAEFSSALLFNPFAVVSQIQMVASSHSVEKLSANNLVAGKSGTATFPAGRSSALQPSATSPYPVACPYPYGSAACVTRSLIRDHGWQSLFRGALVSALVAPVVGGWWFMYEALKGRAYAIAPFIIPSSSSSSPLIRKLPHACTSTSDNVLINALVGATTNMMFCLVMNPIYVLRLRVQTCPTSAKYPFRQAMREMLEKEGPHALWKGLSMNMWLAILGGLTFGFAYEGTKQLSGA